MRSTWRETIETRSHTCYQKVESQACVRVSIYTDIVHGQVVQGTEIYVQVDREGNCTCEGPEGSDLDPGLPLSDPIGTKLAEWCFSWTDIRRSDEWCSCPDNCKGEFPMSRWTDTVKIPGLVGKTFTDVNNNGVVSAWIDKFAKLSIPTLTCCENPL